MTPSRAPLFYVLQLTRETQTGAGPDLFYSPSFVVKVYYTVPS